MGRRPRTIKAACRAPNCNKHGNKRGWCSRHYQQMYHYGRLLEAKDPEKLFWSRVQRGAPEECWPWTKAPYGDGYGMTRNRNGEMARAHRVSYEYAVGPIPAGKVLDHICHDPKVCELGVKCPHRRCCNPHHLKPVTSLENSDPDRAVRLRGIRATHCPRGHEYTTDNTRTDVRGGRHCRECERNRY
jgi:hypothetical protein